MWDLLSSRYASPLAYIEGLMKLGDIADGLKMTIEQADDEKLWELYIHSFSKKSFIDWKKDVIAPEVHALSEAEITTQVNMSQDILEAVKLN